MSVPPSVQTLESNPRLSVAVITKNEGDRIRRLLDSVSFADEILVVDSGSTDSTVEMCQTAGAKVVYQQWLGYAAQKQFAMDLTDGEWVLSLDADEAISDSSRIEIIEAIGTLDPETCGFSFPRLSWYLNRWIRHGGWFPDRKVRLVRRGTARWVGDGLHEKLEVDGGVVQLINPIYHFVYRNIFDQIRTVNSFSSAFASNKRMRFPRFYLVVGFFHAIGKFLECAFWKLGFLDGAAGFVIAMNSAFYVFLKHAKVWECGLDQVTHVDDF